MSQAGIEAPTPRFLMGEQLGEGALGRVFRARDSATDMQVAVKRLRRKSADDAVWLKREFRYLADVAHPNLVELYELVVDGDDVLVSMEHVDGATFVEHVRAARGDELVARVVAAASQLAEGLQALHAERRLHRDIKPGNVLVDGTGRVVLLDFDLGVWAERDRPTASAASAGTPAYMAPEALFGKASAASDWFGVGVLLFEALTGRLPLPSASAARRRPSTFAPDLAIPATLDDLVVDLLEGDVTRRADYARTRATLLALAQAEFQAPAWSSPTGALWAPPFVGRSAELDRIERHWAEARERGAAPLAVLGPSGIGKSALVRAWLSGTTAPPGAVLYGRCNPHESMPYRGLDGVMDSLKELLERRSADAAPTNIAELAVMFPALTAVAGGATSEGSATFVRSRAVGALRELLQGLGAKGLLIWIDDLQWSGRDTMELLDELLADGGSPGVLWIFTGRSADALPKNAKGRPVELSLAPLERGDITSLLATAQTVVGLPEPVRERLVDEAAGSPFVAGELARWLVSSRGDHSADADGARVIARRVAALPKPARDVLELVSLGALPIPRQAILDAAGVVATEPWLAHLRAERLLRRSADASQLGVETTHDQIREAVVGQLEASRRRSLHRTLAEAIERQSRREPDLLLHHWTEAGDGARAVPYAIAAAERAEAALAFNRAAELYGRALKLGGAAARSSDLQARIGRALARAGRTAEAASAFGDALASAEDGSRHELLRERAEQYLRGGDRERGLAALVQSLEHQGLRYPASEVAALRSVLLNRARIWWLGGGLKDRPRSASADELCRQSDASWSAGLGLNMFDMMRSFAFQTDHVRLALESGDDLRVLYAVASEVVYRACEGGKKNQAHAVALTRRARQLSDRVGSADATAMMELSLGVGEYFSGRFDAALPLLDTARKQFSARHEGTTWEVLNCWMYRTWSLRWRGDLAQLRRDNDIAALAAQRQGNRLAEMVIRNAHGNLAVLAYEGPDAAVEVAERSIAPFAGDTFQSPQYMHLLARAHCDLARGDGDAAWSRIEAAWPKLRSLGFFRMQLFRSELTYLRACAALAAARERSWRGERKLVREATGIARALQRDDSPVVQALGRILALGVDGSSRGSGERTLQAADAASRAGLHMHAALLRMRIGRASSWRDEQDVPDPSRLERALLPRALWRE